MKKMFLDKWYLFGALFYFFTGFYLMFFLYASIEATNTVYNVLLEIGAFIYISSLLFLFSDRLKKSNVIQEYSTSNESTIKKSLYFNLYFFPAFIGLIVSTFFSLTMFGNGPITIALTIALIFLIGVDNSIQVLAREISDEFNRTYVILKMEFLFIIPTVVTLLLLRQEFSLVTALAFAIIINILIKLYYVFTLKEKQSKRE